ncbi:MAG: hypothetical protein WCC39_19945, partial [Telluria sp.]
MRLIIDFDAPQAAPPQDKVALLALAGTLLRESGAHSVHVAVSARHPGDADMLRHALDGLVPPARFHVYAQPDP